eukprot:Rmarinus@m.17203
MQLGFTEGFDDGLRKGMDILDPVLGKLQRSRSKEMLTLYDEDEDEDDVKGSLQHSAVVDDSQDIRFPALSLILPIILLCCAPLLTVVLWSTVVILLVVSPLLLSIIAILFVLPSGRKILSSTWRCVAECVFIFYKEVCRRCDEEIRNWHAYLGLRARHKATDRGSGSASGGSRASSGGAGVSASGGGSGSSLSGVSSPGPSCEAGVDADGMLECEHP